MIVAFRPLIFSKGFTCFHNMIYLKNKKSFIENKDNSITKISRLPKVYHRINYVSSSEFLNLVENYGQRTVIEINPKKTDILEKYMQNSVFYKE